jgi:CheY-like chemotaxis protein
MMTAVQNILLVEDNANDVELTLAALRGNRVANEVVVLRDGAEALEYLFRRGKYASREADHPALILLDLKMPKVNGLEVLRQVKGDAYLRKIPVVMLTSSREDLDLHQTYDLGVNAYVVKPVVFGDFVDAVKIIGQFWAIVNEPPPAA